MLLRVVHVPFSDIFYSIMRQEIINDPNDFLFQTVNSFLITHPFSVTYFLAVHLLFWGVVDIGFSIALLKQKMWAFPVSLVLIGCFMSYEIYRYFHTHSMTLLAVLAVDAFVFWLIAREYNRVLHIHLEPMP